MALQLHKGKLGIVTGASRGIGEAIAKRLAAKGCNLLLVYASASSKALTEGTAADLSAAHQVTCHAVQADLADAAAAATTILSAAHHLSSVYRPGKPLQVDILINNAGAAVRQHLNGQDYNESSTGGGGQVGGPVTAEEFTRVYSVNVLGPLLLTQAVAPHLPTDRSGRIVNMSSISSSLGITGQSVYGGSKAALEAMTRTWSRELATRATVNAVNPGPVWTDMYVGAGSAYWKSIQPFVDTTPLNRYDGEADILARLAAGGGEEAAQRFDRIVREEMGHRRPALPDEVAGTVDMLCSEEAGWTTGSVVCANGGMRMSFV